MSDKADDEARAHRLSRKPEDFIGIRNPDRAGKVHRPHDRYAEVSTACGATRLGLTWAADPTSVSTDELCPRCWPASSAVPVARGAENEEAERG